MSISSEITRLNNAKASIKSSIENKGITVSDTKKLDEYSSLIDSIEVKKPEQSKSVTPTETVQNVTPDSGYVLNNVSVGAISNTYVGSGVTKKSAQIYTPGTSDQTIASGQYLSGDQTIKGDVNLVADNIKSGTSIFGITGTHQGGSTPNLQSKSVTYTSNGTATITPDAGYDGLSSVEVTVNVSGGGGAEIETINGYVFNSLGVPIKVFYFDGANAQSRSLLSGSTISFDVPINSILCTVETNGNLEIDMSMPDTAFGERLFLSNTTHIISLTEPNFYLKYGSVGGSG